MRNHWGLVLVGLTLHVAGCTITPPSTKPEATPATEAATQPTTPADADAFQKIPLIGNDDIEITLWVRKVATAADREFIGFVINNKSGRSLQLGASTLYQIGPAQKIGPTIEARNSLGWLGSGVVNSGYPEVPPGEFQSLRDTSAVALRFLGVPDANSGGFTVKATVRVELKYEGKHLTTPANGVPLEFEWQPPDEAGIADMRKRLRGLLTGAGHPIVLATLLNHPLVGSTVTTSELLKALDAWGDESVSILRYLDHHRNRDEALIGFVLEIVKTRDHRRSSMLGELTSVRDVRLMPPLREWVLAEVADVEHGRVPHIALEMLSKHIDLAPDRDALTNELGKVQFARCRITRTGKLPAAREEIQDWAGELRFLALTRDRNLIPKLLPYLEHREIVVDVTLSAVGFGISPRACDVAYDTILEILGRDDPRLTAKTRGAEAREQADPKAAYARRDAMIAKLKAEFAR